MVSDVPQTTEGYIPFQGYRTWYRAVGDRAWDARHTPVLVPHGGPGAPHDYLEPLAALAAVGRRVIFYDQQGCGRSDHPHQPGLWTVRLFVEELAAVNDFMRGVEGAALAETSQP